MLSRVKFFFANFEEILCGFFLCTMVTLVIVNVFVRYVFSDFAIFWVEEVSTLCFVWLVFVGAAACYKHRMDIGIDVFVERLPDHIEKIVRTGVDVILLLINGYIFYMAIVFTKISYIKPTPVLGVSSAIFNSALIVGFGLITLHTIRFLVTDVRERIKTRRQF
jgi:TRAP-type C4-dicarboxylate transport system permease small subunit